MATRPGPATRIPEDRFVFNIVWTGTVFTYLRYFVASQIAHSQARFRFVANGCPPEQIAMMEAFQRRNPERVTDVLVACDEIAAHGVALDITLQQRDDGEFFALIDPDIAVSGPFVADFAERLEYGAAGVGSGRGVWRDDSYLPEGQAGVSGEYFYAPDGFLFGSPHFSMYRRAAIEDTVARWGVGFQSAGRDISDAARKVLEDSGRWYFLFDTGKVLNILLQHDGHRLEHFEHRHLMHIGGMSHYLSQPDIPGGGINDPRWPWPVTRLEVARYCSAVLGRLSSGLPAPEVPAEVDPSIASRLERVRTTLIELVETYGDTVDAA